MSDPKIELVTCKWLAEVIERIAKLEQENATLRARMEAPVTDEQAKVSFEAWEGINITSTKWDDMGAFEQKRWKRAILASRSSHEEPKP